MTPKERYDATEEGMRLLREKKINARVKDLIDKALKEAGLSEEQLIRQVREAGVYVPDSLPAGVNMTIDQLGEMLNVLGLSLMIRCKQSSSPASLPPYREPYYIEGGPSLGYWASRETGILSKPKNRLALYPEWSGIRYWYKRTDRKWVSLHDGIERTVFTWTGEECD